MANKGKTEQGVGVQFRIATGVFVTVLGRNFPKTAKITSCQLEWPDALVAQATTQPATTQSATTQPSKLPDPALAVIVRNTGKARFTAEGKMLLLDSNSRIAYSAPVKADRPCVFAGDSRRFEAPLTKSIPPGKYLLKVNLDYGSAWNRVRYEMPVEISPEQAARLALAGTGHSKSAPPIKVTPDHITQVIPAGATRVLALAVTNPTGNPLRCSATTIDTDIPLSAESWITVEPQDSAVAPQERKSLRLSVHVPPETPPGKYVSEVAIEVGPEGAEPTTYVVPLNLEVRTEKSHG
jgi:hypothetical protein